MADNRKFGFRDLKDLAKKGIIVVSVNYRLGAFGFLAHPSLRRSAELNVAARGRLTGGASILTDRGALARLRSAFPVAQWHSASEC